MGAWDGESALFAVLLLIALLWAGLWMFRIRPRWLARSLATGAAGGPPGGISLIVPARNEERTIPALLNSLRGRGPADMEIIVVDDQSTDDTAAAVQAAMAQDRRLRLVCAPAAPPAWSGKTWALAHGIEQSRGAWLAFCDADVVLDADAFAAAWTMAERERLDCISLIPRMENPRLAVALLLACYALSRALFFAPAGPARRGIVQGAFLMVRRQAYEAAGGYQRIKASLLEDVDLGRRLQDAGFRVAAVPAQALLRTPMYGTLQAAVEGLIRQLFAALGFSAAGLKHDQGHALN